jgi:multiple sugar transport system permease protein
MVNNEGTLLESTSGITKSKPRALQIRLKTRESIAAYLFLTPFLLFFAIFVVRGVAYAVQMSFYDYAVLGANRPYIGLANYQELFNDKVWWESLGRTLLFAVMTVTGTTIVALFAAVSVNAPIRGRNIFRIVLYMPSLLSVGVVGLTWVWLLNTQFGIINYALSFVGITPINWLGDENLVIPALSLATIWWGFGFPMLIFIAGLQGIPEQLYEAARIDGANGRQLFRFITVPLLRPTILFVTVTGFIAHLQVFGQPFIITRGGPGRGSYTAIYYLYEAAWRAFRMGYGSAIAITLAAIIIIFTIIQFGILGRRRVEY